MTEKSADLLAMEVVNTINTQLYYNQSALPNNQRSSLCFQKPSDLSIIQSNISTTSPIHSKLPRQHQRYSETLKAKEEIKEKQGRHSSKDLYSLTKGTIITGAKEEDRSLFDAAEAEAITLVRQHQASYMVKSNDMKESGPILNSKQEMICTAPISSERPQSRNNPAQAREDSPKAIRVTSVRQNPFQRAKHQKPTRTTDSGYFTTITQHEKNSNKLPSLLRESDYISNSSATLSTDTERRTVNNALPMYRNGMEVRSDEIKAATSMKLGDRSPKLPSPFIISRSPKRPIVSFTNRAQGGDSRSTEKQQDIAVIPPKESATEQPSSASVYQITPTQHEEDYTFNQANLMNHQDAQPFYNTTANVIPSIQVSCDDEDTETGRDNINTSSRSALPNIVVNEDTPRMQARSQRKQSYEETADHTDHTHHGLLPLDENLTDVVKAPGYSYSRIGALCNNCALPISGRIVSAAGHRFHPECFRCYYCGEGLECVAFYPEPEGKREERLLRCFENLNHEIGSTGKGEADYDNDASMRFYCHLDYHEFFSPRCKSCKTPIEGKVVVACGAHWHVGHFFCAECGDVSKKYQHCEYFLKSFRLASKAAFKKLADTEYEGSPLNLVHHLLNEMAMHGAFVATQRGNPPNVKDARDLSRNWLSRHWVQNGIMIVSRVRYV